MIFVDVSQRYSKTGIGKYCSHLKDALSTSAKIEVYRMSERHRKLPLQDLFLMIKALFNTLLLPEERFLYLALTGARSQFIVLHDLRWLNNKDIKSLLLKSGFFLANKLNWYFIAASPVVRAELDRIVIDSRRVFSLFNCVDEPERVKAKADEMPNAGLFRLIYVGSFEPRKNVDQLLTMVLDNDNVELTLVCSPFYWEKRFQTPNIDSLIKKLDGRLRVMIGISDEELSNEYFRSDAYISLSDFEGFGRPLIEAQSCGLPVIANSSQSTEIVLGTSFVDIKCYSSLYEVLENIRTNYGELQTKGLVNSSKYSKANFKKSVLSIFHE